MESSFIVADDDRFLQEGDGVERVLLKLSVRALFRWGVDCAAVVGDESNFRFALLGDIVENRNGLITN